MGFTFRNANDGDDDLINNKDVVVYPKNMSEEMKDLLTGCNKLKVDSSAKQDTIVLTLESGGKRAQMKKNLTEKQEKYIKGGQLDLSYREDKILLIKKVSKPAVTPAPSSTEEASA